MNNKAFNTVATILAWVAVNTASILLATTNLPIKATILFVLLAFCVTSIFAGGMIAQMRSSK